MTTVGVVHKVCLSDSVEMTAPHFLFVLTHPLRRPYDARDP